MEQFRRTAVLPLAGFILAYAPLLLFVDARLRAPRPGQYLLGILTFAVLWTLARAIEERERYLVWLCVGVATGFEILGSLIWGAYRYRFGGIPLFVPFGHGLIFVFATVLSETRSVRNNARTFTWGVLGAATLWALLGTTVLPHSTGRVDLHGALWLPIFAYAVLRSPRRVFFAALFIATSEIELVGTFLGNWSWAATTPWLHVSSGNPPSAIAGGYAIIDGSMLWLAAFVKRLRELRITWIDARPAPAYVPIRVSGSTYRRRGRAG
jgi:hypothetical protein